MTSMRREIASRSASATAAAPRVARLRADGDTRIGVVDTVVVVADAEGDAVAAAAAAADGMPTVRTGEEAAAGMEVVAATAAVLAGEAGISRERSDPADTEAAVPVKTAAAAALGLTVCAVPVVAAAGVVIEASGRITCDGRGDTERTTIGEVGRGDLPCCCADNDSCCCW